MARAATPLPAMNDMPRHAATAAGLLKSLAHPARLLVMCRLVEGEASVTELQALGKLSMSALSQHLAVLRAAGLVQTRRDAQTIFYGLVDSPALAVLQALHDAYCAPKRSRAQAAPRKAPSR
jgi:DNA-binding transcriptional ArsR family regulator